MMRIVLLFSLFPLLCFSQNDSWQKIDDESFIEAIIHSEDNLGTNESYSLQTTYSIYKNYDEQYPQKKITGTLTCQLGKEINVRQLNFIMIQDGNYNVTIDTLTRQVIVQQPDSSLFYRKKIQDYAKLTDFTEVIYHRVKENKYRYMLEFKKGFEFTAMELVFSPNNEIVQVTMYSNQPYYLEDETTSESKAKIILDIAPIVKGEKVDFTDFIRIRDCITIQNEELVLQNRYKEFELIDLRQ